MTLSDVRLVDDEEYVEVAKVLEARIIEYNEAATGYRDGRWIGGVITDDQAEVVAGFNGHTWGGCCQIDHVWVHESLRGQGIGSKLMDAAEAEARNRGCDQVVLSSHSFQAPGFYVKRGYSRIAEIEGRPRGHSNVMLVKALHTP
jgi:GNAT superfamily N-acetyltransferase